MCAPLFLVILMSQLLYGRLQDAQATPDEILAQTKQAQSTLSRSRIVVSVAGTREICPSKQPPMRFESDLLCERYNRDGHYMVKRTGESISSGGRAQPRIDSVHYEMFADGRFAYIYFPGSHVQIAREPEDYERYQRLGLYDAMAGGFLFGGLSGGEAGKGMYRTVFELLETADSIEITSDSGLVRLSCELPPARLDVWLDPKQGYNLAKFDFVQEGIGTIYRSFVEHFRASAYQDVGGRSVVAGGDYSIVYETVAGERWREQRTATVQEIELFPSPPDGLFSGASIEEGTPVRFAEDRDSGIVTKWSGGKPEIDTAPEVAQAVAQAVQEHQQQQPIVSASTQRAKAPEQAVQSAGPANAAPTESYRWWWTGGAILALAAVGVLVLILRRA